MPLHPAAAQGQVTGLVNTGRQSEIFPTNRFICLIFGRILKSTESLAVILVTGGTGFLGSTLIKQLVNAGHRVRATKRSSSTIPDMLSGFGSAIEWVDADITDYFALSDACQGVSDLYHCAAMVSYQAANKAAMMRTNVEGTAHIVNIAFAHGIRLVHVSSITALGEPKPGQETTEEDWWEYDRQKSGYSIAKHAAEMEVWRGIAEGLDAVIVNPSLIIGPAAGDKGSGAVFSLVHRGLKFYATGSVGLVDVEDVAQAMILLMSDRSISGERFIVSHVNKTHQALLTEYSRIIDRPPPRIKATPSMLGVAWRGAWAVSLFSGKPPLLTKESVRASCRKLRFSNRKLKAAIDIEFTPLEHTLRAISLALTLKENKRG